MICDVSFPRALNWRFESKVKPTVLVATTARWFPTTRLAMALAKVGFAVEAVCPSDHTLGRTGAVRRIHTYHALTPLASFATAITAATPDLIIPADDLAARHLHQLYKQERDNGNTGTQICDLIERSLGAAEGFETVYARTSFMQIAQEEGVRAPKTEIIADTHDLTKWIARLGFPTVLKANATSGGDGVKVVNSVEEAEHALRKLQAPPLMARAFKRALVNRDPTLVWSSLFRRRFVVNGQAFVSGREATSTIACWKGKVLASLHFEVLKKAASTGHATVLRLIEHPEMVDAAEKIARTIQAFRIARSGFHAGGAHGECAPDRNKSPNYTSGTFGARDSTRPSSRIVCSLDWQRNSTSAEDHRKRYHRAISPGVGKGSEERVSPVGLPRCSVGRA